MQGTWFVSAQVVLGGPKRDGSAGGQRSGGRGGAVLPLAEGEQAQSLADDVAVVEVAAGGNGLLDESVQPLGKLDGPNLHGTSPGREGEECWVVPRREGDSAT